MLRQLTNCIRRFVGSWSSLTVVCALFFASVANAELVHDTKLYMYGGSSFRVGNAKAAASLQTLLDGGATGYTKDSEFWRALILSDHFVTPRSTFVRGQDAAEDWESNYWNGADLIYMPMEDYFLNHKNVGANYFPTLKGGGDFNGVRYRDHHNSMVALMDGRSIWFNPGTGKFTMYKENGSFDEACSWTRFSNGGPFNGMLLADQLKYMIGAEEGRVYFMVNDTDVIAYDAYDGTYVSSKSKTWVFPAGSDLAGYALGAIIDNRVPGVVYIGWDWEGPVIMGGFSLYTTVDATFASPETGFQVTITQQYNAGYTLPSSDPTRLGFSFGGWYTESNGGGTRVLATTTVRNHNPHSLYAYWIPGSQVSVTFHADGGTPEEQTLLQTNNDLYHFPPNPTRANYDFAGWYTQVNKGGIQITASSIVNVSGSTQTLYAGWRVAASVVITDPLHTGDTDIGTWDPGENPTVINNAPVNVVITDGDGNDHVLPGHLDGNGHIILDNPIPDDLIGNDLPISVIVNPGTGDETNITGGNTVITIRDRNPSVIFPEYLYELVSEQPCGSFSPGSPEPDGWQDYEVEVTLYNNRGDHFYMTARMDADGRITLTQPVHYSLWGQNVEIEIVVNGVIYGPVPVEIRIGPTVDLNDTIHTGDDDIGTVVPGDTNIGNGTDIGIVIDTDGDGIGDITVPGHIEEGDDGELHIVPGEELPQGSIVEIIINPGEDDELVVDINPAAPIKPIAGSDLTDGAGNGSTGQLRDTLYTNITDQPVAIYTPEDGAPEGWQNRDVVIDILNSSGEIIITYPGHILDDGTVVLDGSIDNSLLGQEGLQIRVTIGGKTFGPEPVIVAQGPSVDLNDPIHSNDDDIGTIDPGDYTDGGITNDAPVVIIIDTDGDGEGDTEVPGHIEEGDDGELHIVPDEELPEGEIIDIIVNPGTNDETDISLEPTVPVIPGADLEDGAGNGSSGQLRDTLYTGIVNQPVGIYIPEDDAPANWVDRTVTIVICDGDGNTYDYPGHFDGNNILLDGPLSSDLVGVDGLTMEVVVTREGGQRTTFGPESIQVLTGPSVDLNDPIFGGDDDIGTIDPGDYTDGGITNGAPVVIIIDTDGDGEGDTEVPGHLEEDDDGDLHIVPDDDLPPGEIIDIVINPEDKPPCIIPVVPVDVLPGIVVPDLSTSDPEDKFIITPGDGVAPSHPSQYGEKEDELVDVHPGNVIDHSPGADGHPYVVPVLPDYPNEIYDYVFDPSIPGIRIIDPSIGETVVIIDIPTGEITELFPLIITDIQVTDDQVFITVDNLRHGYPYGIYGHTALDRSLFEIKNSGPLYIHDSDNGTSHTFTIARPEADVHFFHAATVTK